MLKNTGKVLLSTVLALSMVPTVAFADAGDAVVRGVQTFADGSSTDAQLTEGWQQFGTCEWQIDAADCLTIRPLGNGESGVLGEPEKPSPFSAPQFPWYDHSDVKSFKVQTGVVAGDTLQHFCLFKPDMKDDVSLYSRYLAEVDLSGLDTSKVTDMSGMFYFCTRLTSLDLSNFDTSNVTNMSYMFSNCSGLTSIDVSNFDTSNVTNMNDMFGECRGLTSLDLSNFDTSNVKNMVCMFEGCSGLTSLDLSNFDTSNVEYMSSMFDRCSALTSIKLGDKFAFSRVAGEEAPQTADAIAKEAFTASEWVIISQSEDFADAMSAAGLAGALQAPILLADPNAGLSADTLDQVKALGATKAYVIGGPGAIKADVATQLKGAGITNITDDGLDGSNSAWRIWGYEAADTSVVCANKIAANGGSTEYAVVAMSDNFQDALSMSSFAYAYKVPIVLETSGATAADRVLPEGAAAVLAGASKQVLVAGGTGALSDASLEGVANTYRLWGDNGFDTSNQIATYLVGQGLLKADTVCIASGASNPKGLDALAGAALAGKNKGVMLLSNTRADFDAAGTVSTVTIEGADSRGTDAFLSTNAASVKSAYVLGGEAVMPAALYELILGILTVN